MTKEDALKALQKGKTMDELAKLEFWLRSHHIPYERIDENPSEWSPLLDRHQICVPSEKIRNWDAICHYGSYGYEDGLLEIYGELVTEDDGDSVVGYLTAADVVKRVEAWLKRGKKND